MSRCDEANENTTRKHDSTRHECDSSSCTALTVTTATRYPLLLKNPPGRHIYWSSEPMKHIIGLENSRHPLGNGAEGLGNCRS